MTHIYEAGIDLPLAASPATKDPKLFLELSDVYHSIFMLADELHKSRYAHTITLTAGTHQAEEYHEMMFLDASAGAITVNLPDATKQKGKSYMFKRIATSGSVIIDPLGAQLVEGGATLSLNSRKSALIQSDGANWWIVLDF